MDGLEDLPSSLDPAEVTPLAAIHPVAPVTMDAEATMRVELQVLRQRHRDLDMAIDALSERGTDPLAVRRLKKRKLLLRDRIADLEDRLTPDIIA